MSTDRLTVTVPHELHEALRKIAADRKESVSSVVAEAIAQEVRSVALGEFLADAKSAVGQVPAALLLEADQVLDRAVSKGTKRKRSARGGAA